MTPGEYRSFLLKAYAHKRRHLAVGPPGIGKTEINAQVAKELGMDMIVFCLPLDDPSTIRGYPRPPKEPEGDATHCLFDGMARLFRATKPTLAVYDDIGQASESTLKAVMRLFQFGELDGRRLPECVVICGLTNDVSHGAGVYGMIEPLKSRFHTIVNVEASVDDIVGYGLAKGWPTWLCAYLRNSPKSVNSWKPSKSMKVDGACPRGWEYLGEWDKIGIEDAEVWAGCVGKGEAAAAAAFKDLQSQLPDLDACLLDPEAAPVPENPSARFLVSMALASRMSAKNFGQCVKYLNRLPAMFRAYSIRDAFRAESNKRVAGELPKDYRVLSSSRDFNAWATSEDGKDILVASGP